ncbi:MAG: hypothetical protein ABI239_09625 [Aquihabitans sp.]
MSTQVFTRTSGSAAPRGPRWFGVPSMVRMAMRDLQRHRVTPVVGAVTGLIGGFALVAKLGPAGSDLRGWMVLAMIAVPATLAAGTHPEQRHEADILLRLGWRRGRVRLTAWLAPVLAVTVPAWVGATIGTLYGLHDPGPAYVDDLALALFVAFALPAVGAWITAGARLPERSRRSLNKSIRARRWRAGIGLLLIVGGAWLPTGSKSGFGLDSSLPVGYFVVFVGLTIVAPVAIGAAARAASAVPSTSVSVASGLVFRERRALLVPFVVVAMATCALTVESVLGIGLGLREQARIDAVDAIGSLGSITSGTSGDQLIITTSPLDQILDDPEHVPDFDTRQTALVEAVRSVAPEASLVSITTLDLEVLTGQPVFGNATDAGGFTLFDQSARSVTTATPDLLAALGEDPALASGSEVLLLDARLPYSDGTVRLVHDTPSGSRDLDVHLPARLLHPGQVVIGLPAVLVPPDLVPATGVSTTPGTKAEAVATGLAPNRVLLRFNSRPSDRIVTALTKATEGEVTRGDAPERLTITNANRTDDLSAVSVRTPGEAIELATAVGLISLAAVLLAQIAMALAHRREDEVLHLLGMSRAGRAWITALRGLGIGLTASASGAAIGLAGTAWGLHRYNTDGRFDHGVTLDPIPFTIPAVVLIGLIAIPLLSALVGGLVAMAQPTADDATRTERLAW